MKVEKCISFNFSHEEMKEILREHIRCNIGIPEEYQKHMDNNYWDIDYCDNEWWILIDGTLDETEEVTSIDYELDESCCLKCGGLDGYHYYGCYYYGQENDKDIFCSCKSCECNED